MKYKITIQTVVEIEGKDYPKTDTIYEQVADDIDIAEITKIVNKIAD